MDRSGVNMASIRDTAWFSLNPVSVTATSIPNKHLCMCTHAHAHTQYLFDWKLTLNCSIQGTKILLSTPKEVTSCNFPPCGATQRGERGRAIQGGRMQAGWEMLRLCSHSPHHPSPCHTAGCTCSERWTSTQSTPPWHAPRTTSIHNLQRE